MPTSRLRKRQGFPNVPGIPLTQRVIPTFLMRRFSHVFADAMVRFRRENGRIGVPAITKTDTPAIGDGNPMPETTTRAFTPVANDKRQNLTRPATHHRPQPAFPCPLAHERPGFIHLQHVVWGGRLECRPQRRQGLDFFLSTRPGLSGRRRIFDGCRAYSAVPDTPEEFLLGVQGYRAVWGSTPPRRGNLCTHIAGCQTDCGRF
jgi:hypothetical protein